MKLKYILSLCSLLILTQAVITGEFELNKYISKAKENKSLRSTALRNSRPDLVTLSSAFVGGTALALSMNPLLGKVAMLYGLGMMVPEMHDRIFATYNSYFIKAPSGFDKDLEKLGNLIDTKKNLFIGGKQYFVAKDFNNTDSTGYSTINNECPSTNVETENILQDHMKNQYEIYLMPDSTYLVESFVAITQALKNNKDDIAFIAIRPTPVLTNDIKQILPRIIIALNKDASKENVKTILKTVYRNLKETIPNIKSAGNWPRYSEQVNFASAVELPLYTSKKLDTSLIFVGMGNSNFKQQYPDQFERKKFLGIIRHGDMAYPVNTPETEKIRTIIIGK